MTLEHFSNKLQDYCRLTGNSRKTLAHELGLHPTLLSHKLKGTDNRTLTHAEVKAIVKILAKWEAISSQDEAMELLALVNCPSFTTLEWRSSPLNQLEGSRLGQVAASINLASRAGFTSQGAGFPATPGYSPDNGRHRHNLPSQLSSFIGREKQTQDVKRALSTFRLVTLTGAGGVGKTRLSLEVAIQVLDRFTEGVWLVELAPLSDPDLITQTIATTLGLSEQAGRPLLATVSDYLRSRCLLLVLDNCEHLIAECARVVDSLMRNSSELHILVTSREALSISGEMTYHVPSLNLPEPHTMPEVEFLAGYEAIRLFKERAGAGNPDFSLTYHNAAAVVQVCRHLDGIPLALELAAARIKVLQVGQLAAHLNDCFRLLNGGSRTALPRHQTLQALVDWSYELLTPAEKRLLAHVSVFAGGWTLGAAKAVSGDSGSREDLEGYDILDVLSGLVNKSLVQLDQYNEKGEARYSLLETIRQYGMEKLQASGEEGEVRERHLSYFANLLEEVGSKLRGPEQLEMLKLLDRELDNIRTAIDYGLRWEEFEKVAKLTNHIYWDIRGYYSEGRRYMEQLLAFPAFRGVSRGKSLFTIGFLAQRQGDNQVIAYYKECVAISREHKDKPLQINAFVALSFIGLEHGIKYSEVGSFTQAREWLEQALTLCEEIGSLSKPAIQLNLGMVLIELGEYAKALPLLEEAGASGCPHVSIALSLGNRARIALIEEDYAAVHFYMARVWSISEEIGFHLGKTDALCYRGINWANEAKFEEAIRSLEESLVMCLKGGMRNVTSNSLVGVARLLTQIGQKSGGALYCEQIACLCGAIWALVGSPGVNEPLLVAPFRSYYHQARAIARSSLDEAIFEGAFARGQAMTLEEAIAYGRGTMNNL
jgi:non-specific serine/threonine protein kinase